MALSGKAPIRLLELLAPLSLALDLGMGASDSWVIRSSILSRALAERCGLGPAAQTQALFVTLLRHLGCSSTAEWEARKLGDERAAHEILPWLMDPSDLTLIRQWLFHPGTEGPWGKLRTVVQTLAGASRLSFQDLTSQHCGVARKAARFWNLGPEVETALDQSYERWDGGGQPRGLAGTALAPAARIAGLALDVVRFFDWGGLKAVVHIVGQRRGTFYDPELADLFLDNAETFQPWLNLEGSSAELLAAEPEPYRFIVSEELDGALAAIAEFADAQTSDRQGWSGRLCHLVGLAAPFCLTSEEGVLARRAALVQGLGRLTVGASVWGRPGPLRTADWERVRLAPYHCERMLASSPVLAPLGTIASQIFERLDGSGYPRGLRGTGVSRPARLLAASAMYLALVSDRPQRRALTGDNARALLLEAAAKGELDVDAVAAVLGAAEGQDRRAKVPLPFQLTPRELDVLMLIARGLSNRAMAAKLGLAVRTVDHHVERLYSKIHVRGRAEATTFAVKNSLVDL